MTHPSEWKKILLKKGVRSDWGIDKITVEKLELSDKKTKFIFTFPKPQVSPECFYALLLFDSDLNSTYYTLELDFGSSTIFKEGGGIVCGQKGPKHLNYGRRCKYDLDEFLKTESRFGAARSANPNFDKLVERARVNNKYKSDLKKYISHFAMNNDDGEK